MIKFSKRIKGREDRLSITISRNISNKYKLKPGDDVKATLTDKLKDPSFEVKFVKTLARCGKNGVLLYVPKEIAHEHNLERDMRVWVTIEESCP